MLGEADQAGLRLAESGDVQPVDAPIVGEGPLRAAAADEARQQVLEVRHGGRAAPEMRRPALGAGMAEDVDGRSEEHTSELQSIMRNSYAVFCLKKKKHQ